MRKNLKLVEDGVPDLRGCLFCPMVTDIGVLQLGELRVSLQKLPDVEVRSNRVIMTTVCDCNRTNKSLNEHVVRLVMSRSKQTCTCDTYLECIPVKRHMHIVVGICVDLSIDVDMYLLRSNLSSDI